MSVNVDLTRKQLNALSKNKQVRLKHEQLGCGECMLNLDNKKMGKARRAMMSGKGLQISNADLMTNDLSGEGLKDILKSVKKGVKKTIKLASPVAKDVYKFTKKEVLPVLKPIAKDVGREVLKENRALVDKGLKSVRERGEQEIEDVLINAFGKQNKELIQDLVTTGSASLSKKASKELDRLEGKVDTVLQTEVGLQKGRDYAYLNPYNVSPEGLNELPVAVAQAIPMMKGEGVHRAVYLKGGSAKKFFKKLGKSVGKIVKSPAVKKILTELGKQAVSAMIVSSTGNPMLAEAGKNLTGNLVESAVNEGANQAGNALGAGMLVGNKTVLKKGAGLYPPMGRGVGGALYPPGIMYKGRGRPRGRGLNGSNTVTKQQGGEYYI
jgi:hypothetical protein